MAALVVVFGGEEYECASCNVQEGLNRCCTELWTPAHFKAPAYQAERSAWPAPGTPQWRREACARLQTTSWAMRWVRVIAAYRRRSLLPRAGGTLDQPGAFWEIDQLAGPWIVAFDNAAKADAQNSGEGERSTAAHKEIMSQLKRAKREAGGRDR